MTINPDVVARLVEQLSRAIHPDQQNSELTAGQWAVLRYLAKAGRSARTYSGVANYLSAAPETVDRALSALLRKNLVSVSSEPTDDKARHVDLADAGVQMLKNDPVHRVRQAILAMPENDWHELARLTSLLLSKLTGALREQPLNQC